MGGLLMKLFPPSKINSLYGYRTESSMRSQERWDFAQRRGTCELIRLGLALMAASLIGFIIEPRQWIAISLGICLMIVGIMVMIVRVERAIHEKFDDD